MEVRKVQITGGATFMITLPKGWAEKVGLRAGSPLRLAPRGEALILLPEERPRPARVIFRLTDQRGQLAGEALAREIISLYIAGFEIIEIRGERISPDQRRVIREVSRTLIGPEIVEESGESIVIHNLLDLSEVSAERTFERIYSIAKSMLEDAVRALLERDSELARDVIGRDSEVDRLFLMLSRQLRIALQDILGEEAARLRLFDYYTATKQVERIADHAVKIARAVMALEQSISPGLRETIARANREVVTRLEGAAQALSQLDLAKANEVIDRAAAMEGLLLRVGELLWQLELDASKRPRAAEALGIVVDSIRRVSDYTTNIAEVVLNAAMPPLHGDGPAQIQI
ncbi:MAG: AbrB/MazE/SpoVT family DNA-binding domain-containing protein [Candidatus Acetothermia bacterium]|jgi:phosphate uptake regulator|nr:AbrB/MazE/SpoVT family DNA-binding domain-containing protein [Candidatus Acetothermia bacterium]MDH7505018.1 PhoU domain-containing protein [Candidatus Acetothermia bacterium]